MTDEELIAVLAWALWDHDNADSPSDWREMAWNDMGGAEPNEERVAYELRATAILPIVRAQQAEALRNAADLLDTFDNTIPAKRLRDRADRIEKGAEHDE